jgi:tellurite methyltransferase
MNYNQIYKSENVWGENPNELLQSVFSQVPLGSEFLDLGCGQGRDVLFMLQNGFQVTGIDNAEEGLHKIEGVLKEDSKFQNSLKLLCADITTYEIKSDTYSIINAYNSLQFLPKNKAIEVIKNIKNALKKDGLAIISGFTTNDILYKKENENTRCFFNSQELRGLFSDCEIILYEEKEI